MGWWVLFPFLPFNGSELGPLRLGFRLPHFPSRKVGSFLLWNCHLTRGGLTGRLRSTEPRKRSCSCTFQLPQRNAMLPLWLYLFLTLVGLGQQTPLGSIDCWIDDEIPSSNQRSAPRPLCQRAIANRFG